MKQKLINTLTPVCSVVKLQGTFEENEAYPSEFITFWTNYTATNKNFDNEEYSIIWNFSVIYYSNDPAQVETKAALIRAALKNAGFIVSGKGNDIPADRPDYTGWALDCSIIEKL